jgi:hypothetical protein
MKQTTKKMVWLVAFFGINTIGLCTQPFAVGPYLGQTPPQSTPQIFAPGLICQAGISESDGTFSADGKVFCYRRGSDVYLTENTDQGWSVPAPVTGLTGEVVRPTISPDGDTLYFYSDGRLAKADRTSQGWTALQYLGAPIISSVWEGGFSLAANNNFYICSWRPGGSGGCDIWYAPYRDGTWTEAYNIGSVNTSYNECTPGIAPDESFMVFFSNQPGGTGGKDLHLTLQLPDGSWSTPRRFGEEFYYATPMGGNHISPDKKYLFFTRSDDIYWVSLETYLPDPNGPITNTTISQSYHSIQLAIDLAESGDTIIISPGVYCEHITLDKDIVLQSVDPNDPYYVGGTIIQSKVINPVLTLHNCSTACVIDGLTLRAGSVGVLGFSTHATLRNCRMMDNVIHGMELYEGSSPHLEHGLITANGQTGITMHETGGRYPVHCEPLIKNCIIVDNGDLALIGGKPEIVDSLIEDR